MTAAKKLLPSPALAHDWIDAELGRIWLRGELVLAALHDAGVRRPSDPAASELAAIFAARRMDRGGSTAAEALADCEAQLPALRATDPAAQALVRLELRPRDLDLLVLACAPVIDPGLGDLFAVLRGARGVDLAIAAQLFALSRTERIAWLDAVGPDRPLVRWRLLDLPALAPTRDALALLGGTDALPPSLAAAAQLVAPVDPTRLSWADVTAQAIARLCACTVDPATWLVIAGMRGAGKRSVAALVAAAAGRPLLAFDPRQATNRDEAFVAAQREAVIRDAVLYVGPLGDELLDDGGRELARLLRGPARIILGVASTEPPRLPGLEGIALDELVLPLPGERTRRTLWAQAAPALVATDPTGAIARGFQLTPGEIAEAAGEAERLAAREGRRLDVADVRRCVERRLRNELGLIANKIEVAHRTDDLVLAEDEVERVREFISRTRRAAQVYDEWGLGRRIGYGQGRIALFSGPPGTGKTMIAGVIARELGLDLYQVDLSQVFSKWVGETEKQLGKLFDQAQRANVVLLFDEADALFGKRTDSDDNNARYANLAVNYLLQRFERYPGVAILTTNREAALDEALQRRLSLHLRLDVPEPVERERLWRSFLGAGLPLAETIDVARLASEFEVTGGYIKNAVVRAAFFAAEHGCTVDTQVLWRATARELEDMGRLVAAARQYRRS